MHQSSNQKENNPMKKLLIILLLISPFSFADWGDVYYCQMTTFSSTTLEGKRTDAYLQKFQFKLDKTKKAMVFGKGGYLGDREMEIRKGTIDSEEEWYAADRYSTANFVEGKFVYAFIGGGGNFMTANCDKF